MKEMKTLTIKGVTREIVDAKARRDIAANCAPAIDDTVSGESVIISDASDRQLIGLHVYGKTEQTITTGKNLCPRFEPASRNGITLTVLDDGTLVLNGTATGAAFSAVAISNISTGTYTVSANNNTAMGSNYEDSPYIAIRDDGMNWKTSFTFSSANKTQVFTVGDIALTSVLLAVPIGVTVNNFRLRLQVEVGSEASEYEPYSGGIPGPNPEHPQKLKNVDSPTIGLYGTNLIDVTKLELGGNENLTVSANDYLITAIGGSDKTYAHSGYDMPDKLVSMLRGKRVRLSADSMSQTVSTAYGFAQVNVESADGKTMYPYIRDTKLTHEFSVPDDVERMRIGVYTNNSSTLLASTNTVTVMGLRLTLVETPEYERFVPAQYFSIPRTLNGIPVTTGGNYTDTYGQQWICDEVDFERSMYVRRIGTKTINGSLAPTTFAEGNNGGTIIGWLYDAIGMADIARDRSPKLCDSLLPYGTALPGSYKDCQIGKWVFNSSGSADNFMLMNVGAFDTAEEAKSWLSDNPVTVEYILANPIETPLTKDELKAFRKLHTNRLNTSVFNDFNAYMEVKYGVDTKTYINNVVAELLAANGIGGV